MNKAHLVAWSSLPLFVLLPLPLAAVGCGGADINAQVAVGTPAPPAPEVGGEAPTSDNADAYDDNDPTALQDFRPALENSGTWQDDPTYGTVWVPSASVVGPDFTPYQTAGHWAYDNDQYVWVSDYDWGWAPFHYGRWVPLDAGGWGWIPGRVYRGAWVNWGADDGYSTVGWYPMGPEFVWRGGVAVGYTYNVAPRWAYVGRGDVFAVNLHEHVMVGGAAAGFAGRVRPIEVNGGARFAGGPAPSKLGFSGGQIPHVSGAAAAGIAKAAAWSHPSTAVAQGAHPATHVPTPGALGAQAHGSVTGGTSATMPGAHGNLPQTGGTAGAAGGTTGLTHPNLPTENAHAGTPATGTPTTFPGAHGIVPQTTQAGGTTPATSGTVTGNLHGNIPQTTPAGGTTPATGGTVSGGVHGATPGVAPTGQPQPKKKPQPGDGAPTPGKGGGGGHGGGGGTHKK